MAEEKPRCCLDLWQSNAEITLHCFSATVMPVSATCGCSMDCFMSILVGGNNGTPVFFL